MSDGTEVTDATTFTQDTTVYAVYDKVETEHIVDLNRMKSVIVNLTGTVAFKKEVYTGTGGIDISEAQDGSIIAVVSGQNANIYSDNMFFPVRCNNAFRQGYSNPCKMAYLDLRGISSSKTTGMWYMFAELPNLKSIDLSNFDTSNASDIGGMFFNCKNLTSVDVSTFDTKNVTDMSQMFTACKNLRSITGLERFNTPKLTTMENMFNSCILLTSLDLSGFDTSRLSNMRMAFRYCKSLSNLKISNFTSQSLGDISHAFEGCSSLRILDISGMGFENSANITAIFGDDDDTTYSHGVRTVYVQSQAIANRLKTATYCSTARNATYIVK